MDKREEITRKKLISRMEPIVKDMIQKFNALIRTKTEQSTSVDYDAAIKEFEEKHVNPLRVKGDRLYAQSLIAFKQMIRKQVAAQGPQFIPKEEQ